MGFFRVGVAVSEGLWVGEQRGRENKLKLLLDAGVHTLHVLLERAGNSLRQHGDILQAVDVRSLFLLLRSGGLTPVARDGKKSVCVAVAAVSRRFPAVSAFLCTWPCMQQGLLLLRLPRTAWPTGRCLFPWISPTPRVLRRSVRARVVYRLLCAFFHSWAISEAAAAASASAVARLSQEGRSTNSEDSSCAQRQSCRAERHRSSASPWTRRVSLTSAEEKEQKRERGRILQGGKGLCTQGSRRATDTSVGDCCLQGRTCCSKLESF